jgi:hypothetical protein
MRLFKRIVLALVVIFVLMQLYRPARTNPPVDQTKTMEKAMPIPPNVEAILSRSCNDCHSSKTVWPWYSNIAPVSWMLVDHVDEGRAELNFSDWATFSQKKKRHKLEAICEQVNKKEMPLPSYLWMHHDAPLSAEDSNAICDWANAEKAKIPASASGIPPRRE